MMTLFKDSLRPRCLQGELAHGLMKAELMSDKPVMVARFGAVEIKALLYGMNYNCRFRWLLSNYLQKHFGQNAGFFPVDDTHILRYAERMKRDMSDLSILASWRPEEFLLGKVLKGVPKVDYGVLGPVIEDYTWSGCLRDKHVLVVHPFAETIEQQYKKRELLFSNPHVLPKFASLQTVKAVQSIAGNNTDGFQDWFEALDYMERQIAKRQFDIALIGCGAYGFCLAATVKRMGRKAVHVGGGLQLYFGIKGKRWDGRGLYNEHWVSPADSERPQNLHLVEGGCYW